MRKIIFVCTGNTCRSPMAEALFNQKMKKDTSHLFLAESAGILVSGASQGASENAIEVMNKEYDIDISAHKPKILTLEAVKEADLILCMEKMQAEILKYKYALDDVVQGKVFALLDYVGMAGGDILDPYGGSYLDYVHTAKQIDEAVNLLIKKTKDKGEQKMIAIGADHGGFALKEELLKHYNDNAENEEEHGLDWLEKNFKLKDYGAFDEARGLEEPEIALKVAEAVSSGECSAGILICRSGIGMSMAANKVKGIRCGLAYNESVAKSIKEHNNANIIALGSDYTNLEEAIQYIEAWKNAEFLNGIYAERLNLISEYESKN
ncbi:MAG: RpiB/LacA/LacB family sugar-phosphate isomerase [Clostridia bacterium]|nr:RpiB/LacA/LacB family sugar-phosphate isomerase [Clostridia bacterium]